jgi:hypothetical protein
MDTSFFRVTHIVSVTLLLANTMLNRNQLLLCYSTSLAAPTKYQIVSLTPSGQFDVSYPYVIRGLDAT